MKAFLKALFTITVFSFLTKLFSFLLKIFLSREIGAEAIGMFQVAMSICMVFATLSSSGLNIIISKKTSSLLSSSNDEKEKVFPLVTACILISLIIAGISISLILLFSPLIRKITSDDIFILLLLMLPCLISVSISCGLNGYFWGKKDYFANSFSEFFEQFLRNILCVILILSAKNYVSGAILSTISMSIACVISTILTIILYLKKGGKFKRPNKKDFQYLIKSSFPITLVRFINGFTHPLIAIIVPLKLEKIGFSSSQALAMFGTMQGMTLPLILIPMMLISALDTILIPDIVNFYAKKQYSDCNKMVNLALGFSIFISCIILPIFISIGQPIGKFLFDNENCGQYLAKSAWIMIPNSISSVTSGILNVLDFEKESSKNFIIGTLVLFISIFILPEIFDILSIPISMGLAMIVSSILNIKVIKSKLNFNLNILNCILKFGIITIPSYIFILNLYSILINYFTNFYCIVLVSGFGLIFYLLLCVVFKFVDVKTLLFKIDSNKKSSSLIE